MPQIFGNNAATTLAAAITAAQTSITLTSATGFPVPTGDQYMQATITQAGPQSAETSWEEVTVTALSGTTATVVRAAESSSAQAWAAGSKFELRVTQKFLNQAALAPIVLASIATPVGVLGNVTFGANGAFTSTTGFGIAGGCWTYFPANVITGSNAAGVYWTNYTSNALNGAAAGTAYNVTLPAGAIPYINTVLTAFSSAAQAAATTPVGIYPLWSYTIPANTIGQTGSLDLMMVSTTNVGSLQYLLGGVQIGQCSGGPEISTLTIMNAGVTNHQNLRNSVSDQYVNTGYGATQTALDTTTPLVLALQAGITAAGQYSLCQFARQTVYPSAP